MKVVILAGGLGSRLSEETEFRPKPMVEVGGKPILWHILKIYSHYGFNDFIICLGYKGYVIKEYFANYFLHLSDITINLMNNSIEILDSTAEPWKITLINTGLDTMTGGRIKRIQKYIGNETFMLTYGDGVSDVNINTLLEYHKTHAGYVTVTAVQPVGKYGLLQIDDASMVNSFSEKIKGDGGWINGGFFVLEPQIFDFIDGDDTVWEKTPLENIIKENKMAAYKHTGFWKSMDTLRDKIELDTLYNSRDRLWKVWGK
ncbi:MAG: glucose-1-phosphate cytidylyltransferase [Nitrospirae bacterium YQR-1]